MLTWLVEKGFIMSCFSAISFIQRSDFMGIFWSFVERVVGFHYPVGTSLICSCGEVVESFVTYYKKKNGKCQFKVLYFRCQCCFLVELALF